MNALNRPIPIALFASTLLLTATIAFAGRNKSAGPIEDAIAASEVVVLAKPTNTAPRGRERTMGLQISQVLYGKGLKPGDKIEIQNPFDIPRMGFRWWREKQSDGKIVIKPSPQQVTFDKPMLLLCLSRRKLNARAKENTWEIDSAGRISAVKVIQGDLCYGLIPGWGSNEVAHAFEDMTKQQLFARLKAARLLGTLPKNGDQELSAVVGEQTLKTPHIGYRLAEIACKLVKPQVLYEVLEDEVTMEDSPFANSGIKNPWGEQSPSAGRTRLVAVLEQVKDNGKLLPLLDQLIRKRPSHRAAIIRAMGRCGPSAIDFLAVELKRGDDTESAAHALAEIGDDRAASILEADICFDIYARPSGFEPVTVPPYAKRWPDRWKRLVAELQKDSSETERVRSFLTKANALIQRSKSGAPKLR